MPSDIPGFDILEIHIVRDRLWAFTSTMKANGDARLVDIFDAEGRFIDSFYLEFPDDKRHPFYPKNLMTGEGVLFVPEQEEDGLVSIGKYRILDLGLFPLASAPGDVRPARRGQ